MTKRIKQIVWVLISKNDGDIVGFSDNRSSARALKEESGVSDHLMIKKAEAVFTIL